jgi:hypothetical protein
MAIGSRICILPNGRFGEALKKARGKSFLFLISSFSSRLDRWFSSSDLDCSFHVRSAFGAIFPNQ